MFKKSHPCVQLILITNSSETIERMMVASKLDVDLVAQPCGIPALMYESFRSEEIVLFASATHPAAKKGRLTREDWPRYRL